jgi:polyisoprenyl-teichoic acid--peptidoglycan teichoic acid transferase
MSEGTRSNEDPEGEESGTDEEDLPPPATWAGRRPEGEEEADEADEQVGEGLTDEFSLEDDPGYAAGAAGEPSEEADVSGAPASGETEEWDAEDAPVEDAAIDGPVAEEPPSEELEAVEPPSEELEAEDQELDDEYDEPAAEEPEEAVTVVKQPAPVLLEPISAEPGQDERPPRAGVWPRFFAAAFVIITSMAAATAASILLYFGDIAESLGGLPGVEDVLKSVDGGEPQTVLILGSDIRPDIEKKGRSDTTMLLRLDPRRDVLSLLSLPRDLKVNIPGYGIGKLNDAYFVGGPKKTLETVQNLTGLDIHHVVNIDFTGFAEAVNEIECVFVDVDRDYFNTNDDALSQEDYYAEIDIDAGYQQLCGYKALQYVRYRHDDNDLVRAARQQSFLREARQKVPPERLFTKREEFIKIFTKYTTSDINDPIAMLDTLKLFIELRDAPVRRIEFQGDIGGPDSAYVTASSEQIKTAVKQFLGEAPAPAEKAAPEDTDDGDGGSGGGGGASSGDGGGGGGRGSSGGGGDSGGDGGVPPMVDASGAAEQYALQFDGKLRFPVYAPTQLVPGSSYSDASRAYTIDTYDGEHYPSYKLVFTKTSDFAVPEYYGVMGTKWTDAPILENPSETRQAGDREYLLFYEGDRLQVVGWKTPQAAYWVSNTLTGTLTEEQMLAVAESMKPFSPQS